jgi:hypothetical protein
MPKRYRITLDKTGNNAIFASERGEVVEGPESPKWSDGDDVNSLVGSKLNANDTTLVMVGVLVLSVGLVVVRPDQ